MYNYNLFQIHWWKLSMVESFSNKMFYVVGLVFFFLLKLRFPQNNSVSDISIPPFLRIWVYLNIVSLSVIFFVCLFKELENDSYPLPLI